VYWPSEHRCSDTVGEDGMRECARGEHCAARTTTVQDGRITVHPARTYRPFCDPDVARLRSVLTDLPRRYAELCARLGERSRPADGPRVSGGGRSTIPLNLGHEAFLRELATIVLSWEETVRTTARLAPVTVSRHPGRAAVSRACATLRAHIEVLLSCPPTPMLRTLDLARAETVPTTEADTAWVHAGWIGAVVELDGAAAGIELFNLHHRALARLGWTPQHHDLRTPCWDCDLPRLRRWDGTAGLSDHVECRECGSQYVGERLRLLMAAEEQLARNPKAS